MREISIAGSKAIDLRAEFANPSHRSVDTELHEFSPLEKLVELEQRFPKVFELFEQVGIHPTKSTSRMNPYTCELSTESFTNIGEHCIAVAFAAAKIMDALVDAGVIGKEEADFVIERALVHDITKPYEIMRKDAKKLGLIDEAYTPSAYEKLKPLLTRAGVSDDLAEYLVKGGKETGHNSLKDFIEVDESGLRGVVADKVALKIVHLADDMTFTSTPMREGDSPVTYFLTPWERALASRFIEKYSFLWKEGLGVDQSGEIVQVADTQTPEEGVSVLGTFADLQIKIARGIAREFQMLIDPTSDLEPEVFIKNLINKQ